MTEKELIAAVRKHAEAHWGENGWDFLVECWSDEDIANCIAGAEDEMIAIARCATVVAVQGEHRDEMLAMSRW
jgi:hypothetical protein